MTCRPKRPGRGSHISPIGSGDEDDNAIYLRYYADDDYREQWHLDFGDPLPPKEKPPYDRDRLLPPQEPLVS